MLIRRLWFPVLFLVPCLLPAQVLRIASYNMDKLGAQRKDYVTLAKVITNFDVVAAEEVMNADGIEKVMGALADGWEAAMSEKDEREGGYKEFFGFFYNERVELYKMLGAYPKNGAFRRPPYGANFKVKGSPFSFNVVACHVDADDSGRSRAAEINSLADVYQHYEKLTGNRGITVLMGDFGRERVRGLLDVVPQKATHIGLNGPEGDWDHIFISPGLKPRVQKADVLYWTRDYKGSRVTVSNHFPVYIDLRAGK